MSDQFSQKQAYDSLEADDLYPQSEKNAQRYRLSRCASPGRAVARYWLRQPRCDRRPSEAPV